MPRQLGTLNVPVVSTLPVSPIESQIVFLTTDLNVYRWDGVEWMVLTPALPISVTGGQQFTLAANSQYVGRKMVIDASSNVLLPANSELIFV